jgi:hypothetical protein
MPISRTSREALQRVIASGYVNSRRLEVYRFVMEHQDEPDYGGLVSRRDVKEFFARRDYGDGCCRRLEELVKIGACSYAGLKPQLGGMVKGVRTTDGRELRRLPRQDHKFYVQHASLGLLLGPYTDRAILRRHAVALATRLGSEAEIMLLTVHKRTGQITARHSIRRQT